MNVSTLRRPAARAVRCPRASSTDSSMRWRSSSMARCASALTHRLLMTAQDGQLARQPTTAVATMSARIAAASPRSRQRGDDAEGRRRRASTERRSSRRRRPRLRNSPTGASSSPAGSAREEGRPWSVSFLPELIQAYREPGSDRARSRHWVRGRRCREEPPEGRHPLGNATGQTRRAIKRKPWRIGGRLVADASAAPRRLLGPT